MSSGLLSGQVRAYELSAITLFTFPRRIFFVFSPSIQRVLYISTHSAVEHRGGKELKPLHCLPDSLCGTERQARGGCQPPHTQLCLSLLGHSYSQWLGRYIDKITRVPATSPFPTFIKVRASYLM